MLDWMKTAKSVADDPVFGFNPDAVTRSDHGGHRSSGLRGMADFD